MTETAGPNAIVTGATSGIGLEITERLASLGNRVFLCARDPDGVTQTVSRLQDKGYDAAGVACDVSQPAQVRELIAAAVARYGRSTSS